MVALPDAFLYYTEQHEEWIREEYDMPSYAVKRDANHGLIKKAAESFGVFVKDTYQFAQFDPGFPDQMWLIPWSPVHDVRMIEVKNGYGQKLTPAEKRWADEWEANGGIYVVIPTLDDAIAYLKAMRRGG